jgi:hypothetical protein
MILKYKAIEVEGKEWISGYLNELNGKYYIEGVEVEKETICLSTGKCDMFGNEVFENDIVVDLNGVKFDENFNIQDKSLRMYIIKYNDYELRFVRSIYSESAERFIDFSILEHTLKNLVVVDNVFAK